MEEYQSIQSIERSNWNMQPYFTRNFGNTLASNQDLHWFLAYDGGNNVIGYVLVKENADDTMFLIDIGILKHHVGHGIGSELITTMLTVHGKVPMYAKLHATNHKAQSFLKKFGFKPVVSDSHDNVVFQRV